MDPSDHKKIIFWDISGKWCYGYRKIGFRGDSGYFGRGICGFWF